MDTVNLMGFLDSVNTPAKYELYRQVGEVKRKYEDTIPSPSIDTSNNIQKENVQQAIATNETKVESLQDLQDTLIVPQLLKSLKQAEGGYQNMKEDKGNFYQGALIGTNHGISAPVLAKHLGRAPTEKDMRELTLETANSIYKDNYYEKKGVRNLPVHLQEVYFHAGVLGESAAAHALQKVLKVPEDGIIGSKTKESMKGATFTKKEFVKEYLSILQKGESWKDYGKGWSNRFNKLAEEGF